MFSITGLLLVFVCTQNVFGQDVQVTLDKDCYNVGDDSMTLTATYSGSDTISAVIWYFSGRDSQDVIVQTSGCSVFQPDSGFPLARMTYKCPPDTADSNTYQLILSSLEEGDFDSYDWGATFQVASPTNPVVVKKQLIDCPTTAEEEKSQCEAGCIAGATIGCACLAGAGAGAYCCIKKKKKGKCDKAGTSKNDVNTENPPDEKKKLGRPQPPPPFGPYSNHSQSPDKRGRANLENDDHPLVYFNTPAQRADVLESIPDSAREDVKKKKKKRKKRVDTEDDQSD